MASTSSPEPPPQHKVSVRFASTLVGNGISLATGFAASLLIARALGPGLYGDLSFVLATLVASSPLIDLGSSSAFYTFLSRRRQPRSFFRDYGLWLSVQFLILALVSAAPSPAWRRWFWLNQPENVLWAALFGGFLSNQLWNAAQQIGESSRETVRVQFARAGVNCAHVLLVCAAALLGRLTVAAVLWFTAAEYAAAIAWFAWTFHWANVTAASDAETGATLRSYWDYCRPLLLYNWLAFFSAYADRWLLQHFGGSIQQGFFSLGQQFAAVSLICTASLINIFWKEIAQAHAQGESARVRDLFFQTCLGLYFVASAIACFALPFSKDIILQLMGPAYASAWPVFAILIFSPLHQSLGQIGGAYLHATQSTRVVLGIAILSLIGLPVSYAILAPTSAAVPGLGLHSTAFALKTLLLQVFTVNALGWVICRRNGWKWPLAYQICTPLTLLCVGGISFAFSALFFHDATRTALALRLAVSGCVFALLTLQLLRRFPGLAGLTPEKISELKRTLRSYAGSIGEKLQPRET